MATWPIVLDILYVVVFLISVAFFCWLAKSSKAKWCRVVSSHRLLQHGESQAHRSMHNVWSHLDAAHTYEASLVPGKCGIVCLLLFRTCGALLFSIGLLYQEYGSPDDPDGLEPVYFTYYTNWTYTAYGLFAALAVIISLRGLFRSSKRAHGMPEAYDILSRIFNVVAVVTASSSLLLTVFYWAALHDYGSAVYFLDVLKHGITAIWMLVEFGGSRTPVVSTWIFWAALYIMCYAVFLWIYWAAANEWVYSVLDWREPSSFGYYIAVSALAVICFWIILGEAWLREAIARRIHGDHGPAYDPKSRGDRGRDGMPTWVSR